MMYISNTKNCTTYFDAKNQTFHENWKDLISIEVVSNASIDAHIQNSAYFRQDPSTYIPVLDGIYPIPPKSLWKFDGSRLQNAHANIDLEPKKQSDLRSFTELFEKFSRRIDCRNIAIELSGGLDSSLIIALAKAIGLDPILIGFASTRWEFRTENRIQEIISSDASKCRLIDYETVLPFSRLQEVPAHALPDNSALHHFGHETIASSAHSLGATVVLNGLGIEPFLVESFIGANKYYLQRLAMENAWANDFIFLPKGLQYLNVAKIIPVYNRLRSLRIGQDLDRKKLWAREHFSSVIPMELSKYSYKAAFDGIFQAGLNAEAKSISNIFDLSFRISGDSRFKVPDLDRLIQNISLLQHKQYVEFIGLLSYALWINALVREKLI
jgi:hypothetical protein